MAAIFIAVTFIIKDGGHFKDKHTENPNFANTVSTPQYKWLVGIINFYFVVNTIIDINKRS